MIENGIIWHVIPTHVCTEFFDPTISLLETNSELYNIVNNSLPIEKKQYTASDYKSILRMQTFISDVKHASISQKSCLSNIKFFPDFPEVNGCICKIGLSPEIFCYLMFNGTAVFIEHGKEIQITEQQHFSIPVYLERQEYEDDFCINLEDSPRKESIYKFLNIMWMCGGEDSNYFSTSKKFRVNGISYVLCVIMLNDPDLISNKLEPSLVKNINAVLDTSPFNNIYDRTQWDLIKKQIDDYSTQMTNFKELSENLVFADTWSGVVVAGDLHKNDMCLKWLLEFEIYLQSHWVLFDAYCENVLRQELSIIELQNMLSRVEFMKVDLQNDITSNIEQSRYVMRQSLISSSQIEVIYSRMHGMLEHKLKLQLMKEEKKKSKYALISDIALLIIAIMQIYGVIVELMQAKTFSMTEISALIVMVAIILICIWFMVKGRK